MNKIYAAAIYLEISSSLSHPLFLLQILFSANFLQTNKQTNTNSIS